MACGVVQDMAHKRAVLWALAGGGIRLFDD